ncbi:2082_t:CDS:2 [Funneliformis mosseae]|uniref:2082_t:CDS:1 n=1 Tax=Funneliformis mosseae TaxID=27381 RepID=A0A9N9E2P3_FUNMO|nr:2082_t:CDS:2 [Funneliformis mosseae]
MHCLAKFYHNKYILIPSFKIIGRIESLFIFSSNTKLKRRFLPKNFFHGIDIVEGAFSWYDADFFSSSQRLAIKVNWVTLKEAPPD